MRWLIFIGGLLVGVTAIRPAIEGDVKKGEPPGSGELRDVVASNARASATSEAATTDTSSAADESAQRNTASEKPPKRDLPPKWRENLQGPSDQTPPRIVQVLPDPGRWVVDNVGLRKVRIWFDESVAIPAGAVTAWAVGSGTVTGFSTSYDEDTANQEFKLTIALDSPIRDDRLTIVLDYSITDGAGNELDGEIDNPSNPTLPSGDGVRGGQAVFRFNILQGDANRDGFTNAADGTVVSDSMGLCTDDAGFEPLGDLNLDGCVNALDIAIFRQGEGCSLPTTDGESPIVTELYPNPMTGLLGPVFTVQVNFSEPVNTQRLTVRSCFLIDESGIIRIPVGVATPPFPDAGIYIFSSPLPQCGTYTVNVSNATSDLSGELLVPPSTPPVLTGLIPPPAPTLNSYTTMTTASQVTITGNAPGAEKVEVVWAPQQSLPFVDVINNTFTVDVPLLPNRVNPIFITALSTCDGVRSAPTVARVTHDTELPNLFIDFPADGAEITTATTDVAGRVGDLLSGFAGLNVQLIVNGDSANPILAVVDVGIGNNGTFFAGRVPLAPIGQPTTIEVTATDELDNAVTKQITVTNGTAGVFGLLWRPGFCLSAHCQHCDARVLFFS